jgi:hypothetical protein
MKNRIASLISATAALLLCGGCVTKMETDPNAPTGPPSATLTVDEWQAAYDLAAATGKGTIHYKDQTRSFSVTGVGAGGTGAQNIVATGKVFNLNSLSDFSGTYTGLRSGLTLFEGKMHEKLTNKKGVIIYLTGKTEGLSSSTGLDEVVITLK